MKLSAAEQAQGIVVSVHDNGIGISDTNIKKLFRIDENFTTIGTNSEQGTGLGLVLCKEFIEKHGGQIWIESREGQGSVFSFSLPGIV
ncbi:MAG: HAMP domain-containing histidine kinase [Bacteroidales bacterium]|nr:HAMP domain-containing histidine kinase [Bacteroidales bacterium]